MSKGGQYFERHQKVFPLDLRYLKSLVVFFWGGWLLGYTITWEHNHIHSIVEDHATFMEITAGGGEIIHALDSLLPVYFNGMISLTTGKQESRVHIHLSPTAAQPPVRTGAGRAVCLPE